LIIPIFIPFVQKFQSYVKYIIPYYFTGHGEDQGEGTGLAARERLNRPARLPSVQQYNSAYFEGDKINCCKGSAAGTG
jgi:hypothetical protein